MKKATIILFVCCLSGRLAAENRVYPYPDSIPAPTNSMKYNWVAPGFLFATGMSIAAIPTIRKIDTAVKNGFNINRKQTHVDDYIQYLPGLAVFALDAAGVKGKYKPQQQLLLCGLSNLTAGIVVHSLKRIVHRERPYGNNFNSFPSGHTSTAFAAAEFLHQEYGHLSPWISIAGYATASATGYLRLYNNQHWLGDVLAGAAIGMASTKMIYWIKKQKRPRKAFLKM